MRYADRTTGVRNKFVPVLESPMLAWDLNRGHTFRTKTADAITCTLGQPLLKSCFIYSSSHTTYKQEAHD